MKPYYEDSSVTIYHGDCREILPELPAADLVLTDPPYGIGMGSRPTKWQRGHGEPPVGWDAERPDGDLIATALTHGSEAIVWGGTFFYLPVSRGWLCWYKPDAPPSMGAFELAWTSMPMTTRFFSWSIAATNGERVRHPSQKPLALMRWCLGFAPEARTILDPFMGSGTTLRAAKDLGRRAIGIELEERYCEIAAQRMAQGVLGEPERPVDDREGRQGRGRAAIAQRAIFEDEAS